MNIVWMAALGVLMTIEKMTETPRFARALGVVFIALGLAFFVTGLV
jgi:predicted metal-binding membrane protein